MPSQSVDVISNVKVVRICLKWNLSGFDFGDVMSDFAKKTFIIYVIAQSKVLHLTTGSIVNSMH